MDITALFEAFGNFSIVAWFALLVVVFAVFVGLGIYQNRRVEAHQREVEPPVPRRAPPRRPAHRKEYT